MPQTARGNWTASVWLMEWSRAEPVLRATYALLDDEDHVSGEDVVKAMGKDPPDETVARAFEHLDKAKYISASFSLGFVLPFLIRPTEKGLQHCAGWPSPGSSATFMAEFLNEIEARASDAATPEQERGRLRRFSEAASGVPKELLTDIAAKVIEHKTGL